MGWMVFYNLFLALNDAKEPVDADEPGRSMRA